MEALKLQKGQIGLVTLLIMAVMLSVGISVVNRTTQDLKISRQEEDSSRVFDATEVGIEEGLRDLNPGTYDITVGSGEEGDPIVNVNYVVEAVDMFEAVVPENVMVEIDTSGNGGHAISVDWGLDENCGVGVAAVEMVAYNTTTSMVRRVAINPCPGAGDGFQNTGSGGADGYFWSQTLGLSEQETLVRIRPIYKDTALRVQPVGWSMGTQCYRVTATGKGEVGKEVKKILVTRTLPAAPSVFDYVLFSGGGVVK